MMNSNIPKNNRKDEVEMIGRLIIYIITVPIAKIISAKNARAWVSMVSYLKS